MTLSNSEAWQVLVAGLALGALLRPALAALLRGTAFATGLAFRRENVRRDAAGGVIVHAAHPCHPMGPKAIWMKERGWMVSSGWGGWNAVLFQPANRLQARRLDSVVADHQGGRR